MIQRADGTRYRTTWLGADTSDPFLCGSTYGAKPEVLHRLFGRWDVETLGGTTEEKATHRAAMIALMSGQASSAGFILRGRVGEQTTHQWSIIGFEDIDIGSRQVKTIKLRDNEVYGGNGFGYSNTLWFAPDYNLSVKSSGSIDMPKMYTWEVVQIRGPKLLGSES